MNADWLPQDVCGNDPGLGFACPATPFRTVDGSCNNLQHPLTWGVALRPFRRVLAADYGDGMVKYSGLKFISIRIYTEIVEVSILRYD